MMAHYRSLSMEIAEESVAMQGDLAAQQQIVERLMSLSADSPNETPAGIRPWRYVVIHSVIYWSDLLFGGPLGGFNKGDTYPNYTKLSNAFEDHFDEFSVPLRKLLKDLNRSG